MIGKAQPRRASVTPGGYQVVVFLTPNGRIGRYIHRMVLETFVGPCPSGKEVSHLNGDSMDNRLTNLTYETSKENKARKVAHKTGNNGMRHGMAKLTDEQVRVIRLSPLS